LQLKDKRPTAPKIKEHQFWSKKYLESREIQGCKQTNKQTNKQSVRLTGLIRALSRAFNTKRLDLPPVIRASYTERRLKEENPL
jgi:hypothetical protein